MKDESQSKSRLSEKNLTYSGRGGELSFGLAAKYLSDVAFDYLLYPFVIFKLGILKGGIVMTFLALIANIMTMKFYDWSKRDWLGIETVKSLKGYEGSKTIGRLMAWALRKSDPIIFLFLSIKFDPFITTAYLRKGANQFNGMKRRDWKIFISSLILSNAYWTLACYMGISLVEWGWRRIIG